MLIQTRMSSAPIPRKRQSSSTNESNIYSMDEVPSTEKELNIIDPSDNGKENIAIHHNSFGFPSRTTQKWKSYLFKFGVFYFVGVLYFCWVEKWDLQTCLYYITQTLSTVAYGDLTPNTRRGRIAGVFYMFVGLILVFRLVGDFRSWMVRFSRQNLNNSAKRTKLATMVRNTWIITGWICVMFVLIAIGTFVFWFNGDFNLRESFYFAAVTATSLGYGDISLTMRSSIWFNILYMIIVVPITALAIDRIANYDRQLVEFETEQSVQRQQQRNSEYGGESNTNRNTSSSRADDSNGEQDGRSSNTEAEKVLQMLQDSGKISQADINACMTKIEQQNKGNDGNNSSSNTSLTEIPACCNGQTYNVTTALVGKCCENSTLHVLAEIILESRTLFSEMCTLLVNLGDQLDCTAIEKTSSENGGGVGVKGVNSRGQVLAMRGRECNYTACRVVDIESPNV